MPFCEAERLLEIPNRLPALGCAQGPPDVDVNGLTHKAHAAVTKDHIDAARMPAARRLDVPTAAIIDAWQIDVRPIDAILSDDIRRGAVGTIHGRELGPRCPPGETTQVALHSLDRFRDHQSVTAAVFDVGQTTHN